jgi:hypothetical protein
MLRPKNGTTTTSPGSPVLNSLASKSSYAAVVLGVVNAPRRDVLPVRNHTAIAHGEPTIIACTHGAHLMTNAPLLPFEACGLATVQFSRAETVADASLLVELALADGVILCGRRRGLRKREGGRCNDGRHKDELHESHGVSPSVAALI